MLRPVALPALLLLSFFSLPASGGVETVRILVGEHLGPVVIQGAHLRVGEDEEGAVLRPVERGSATVRRGTGGRLELDGEPVPSGSARFRAGDPSSDTETGAPGDEPLTAGDIAVRGDVVARLHRGRIQLVNVIPLETYLVAVLGSEMPREFPGEALKAQAVAARTYALWKKLESYGAPYNMGSGVLHQVYAGLASEDPRTRAAVEATAGEILTHELQPIEAYFHASCGGRTESGLLALGRDLPYLAPVECPCGSLPASRWSLSLPLAELRRALPGASTLEVLSRTPTGRARMVRLSPDQALDAVTVRQRLGYTRLKSLDFSVSSATGDALEVTGKGYGHGAGLCQWGAKAQADRGWDHAAILLHYYPGTELRRLY